MHYKKIQAMKQPELGKHIFNLRKEKGLTQEELVEQCNINVRTIQRIEAGEVNPRSYTVKLILEVLGEDLRMLEADSLKANSLDVWSANDLKKLNRSWFFGIFYAIVNFIGIIIEIYLVANDANLFQVLAYRIPFAIVFFALLIPFLQGYKLLAEKFDNTLLKNAVPVYIGISVLMTICTFFTGTSNSIDTLEIALGVFTLILFGTGELIMGLAILKLKESVGASAQLIGILKIVNGILLISVLLAPIALLFALIILIFEILFLYNLYQKFNTVATHDDRVHSLKL